MQSGVGAYECMMDGNSYYWEILLHSIRYLVVLSAHDVLFIQDLLLTEACKIDGPCVPNIFCFAVALLI